MIDFEKDIRYIKGVGPARVELLNKLGIYTLEDILTYFPRDYEDRGKYKLIAELENEETVAFRAIVTSKLTENRIRKGMTIYKTIARDESGSVILSWFNQAYIKNTLFVGKEYIFFGKVKKGIGRIEVQSPIFEEIGKEKNTGKIIPLYPLTNGITQNVIRNIIENAMNEADGKFLESLPQWIIHQYKLCNINFAMKNIHFPNTFEDFEKARYRIAFEELLILQTALLMMKYSVKMDNRGIKFDKDEKIEDLLSTLPYKLTNAQSRVWNEIDSDMKNEKCMNRLVQGDVGSGKTAVAMLALYKACKNGYQAAMMAPTSILAKQHYLFLSKMLEPFGIKCELFTSEITKKKKQELIEDLKNGKINIAIGTHALIEENIEFQNLGLVITDEQHRFGVRQRGLLSFKGTRPDVLVMTATPIPRTLAMILYGDLDISIIDELPPGRQKIETYAVRRNMEERVNNFVIKEMKEGRQAYIVCPLVEESENMDGLKSVIEQYDYYKQIFKDFKVAILHGKMRPKEKDEIMTKYKNKEIDVLISTTVIEVGVDVPNATIMVIENAERFGLAQLHQLRGRVGRGKFKSYCILKYDSNSDVVKQRMEIMQKSNDGFVISEKDLELRGPGEFFGTRQHGIPEFKVANLYTDMTILKIAGEASKKLLEADPSLLLEENIAIKQKIDKLFASKEFNTI
ncbi:MAG: ATP-dependent DNA helicase RecG [Clostridia bacterium]|nr:ATP-dependent DNA helicase RecG [Clostridia bacterium]